MSLHAFCRVRPYMPCVVPLPITFRSGSRRLQLSAGLLFSTSREACHIRFSDVRLA